jgi:dTDP-4-amino-4,6-dideoxygalactose transaminase
VTNNGTVPLQIALKLLGGQGEIITTPFSYVGTTAAIVWENRKPVFVDIHPEYLTINETKNEAAITDKTIAILATHVYGNPCNVVDIEAIAKKYNLKVIYNTAHCFGVIYKNKTLFEYGHNVKIGDFSHINAYSFMGGFAVLKEVGFFNTRATFCLMFLFTRSPQLEQQDW